MNHTSWTEHLRIATERAEKAEARVRELEAHLDGARRWIKAVNTLSGKKAESISNVLNRPTPSGGEGSR